jgi:bifunctional NMN adenylyltransferase/nudix hydrolase
MVHKSSSVGVVIGRFQIHELHDGHLELLNYVADHHEKFLILVGYNTVRFNTANPFPPEMRVAMLKDFFPEAEVLPLLDSPVSPQHWSATVDALVEGVAQGNDAVLYGSRDSFIPDYFGRYKTVELSAFATHSATEIRDQIGRELINDPMFRRGWLAAIHRQYTVTDPTVDVAIYKPDFSEVLLGRRGAGSPLRFFGGFVDPDDDSYEVAAMRERTEEALGIKVGQPIYLGSKRINDPRYRNTPYGIMTTFFGMEYFSGTAEAGDDMGLAEWAPLIPELLQEVSPTHHGLYQLLLNFKEKQLGTQKF